MLNRRELLQAGAAALPLATSLPAFQPLPGVTIYKSTFHLLSHEHNVQLLSIGFKVFKGGGVEVENFSENTLMTSYDVGDRRTAVGLEYGDHTYIPEDIGEFRCSRLHFDDFDLKAMYILNIKKVGHH